MVHGGDFPLFQRVDSLLDENVFLSHVAVLRMVLSSKHLLLFLQIVVLAGQTQHIDVKNRALFRQLNQFVLHGLIVVGRKGLKGCL